MSNTYNTKGTTINDLGGGSEEIEEKKLDALLVQAHIDDLYAPGC